MIKNTDNLRINSLHPLLPPAILMEELPITEKASNVVSESRRQSEEIVRGADDRLLVVVGPCSIHDIKAALEYAEKLAPVAALLSKDLIIVMRVYFEKPRTTIGWKGLINDPDIDGSFRINKGLRAARKLLIDLAEMGLPAGSEFLDTIVPQFTADLISWVAIGARTTESQVHRELASGLSMPVGFKNGTSGNVQIAIDAVGASCQQHHFLSVTKQGLAAIVETKGNDCCHLILRGSNRGPNFDGASIGGVVKQLTKQKLWPSVMVDCSHGNSSKDHRKQPEVAAELSRQISEGSSAIFGIMLESHLVEGKQKFETHDSATYGQSITDACISWEQTQPILEELAAAVRTRRTKNNASS
ncbi:MAG: Phospho-2-dehydro-3-deoxyheptonate aldolase, Phe-sensitive [Verrucomicrobia subdivision 3 bacterium]|nr:Phospho-2-dehydro-3-deoxyheptonate aldolase, Phe-sensitive [Limisphaerales bacterium]MCS1414694.1 Phospho-2-dehydro-3-deoxyheptonate aldolase, Phe-sensitive [Limisphaerales bacterium]